LKKALDSNCIYIFSSGPLHWFVSVNRETLWLWRARFWIWNSAEGAPFWLIKIKSFILLEKSKFKLNKDFRYYFLKFSMSTWKPECKTFDFMYFLAKDFTFFTQDCCCFLEKNAMLVNMSKLDVKTDNVFRVGIGVV